MIEITVRGQPVPQGSGMVPNGHGGVFSPRSARVRPWREAIRSETDKVIGEPLTGPVGVFITFAQARPKSHYRTGRNSALLRDSAPVRPDLKPDADKLARAVLDGLTDGGAWKDDAQVVDLGASKTYGQPGCTIWIWNPLEESWPSR